MDGESASATVDQESNAADLVRDVVAEVCIGPSNGAVDLKGTGSDWSTPDGRCEMEETRPWTAIPLFGPRVLGTRESGPAIDILPVTRSPPARTAKIKVRLSRVRDGKNS